MLRSFILFVSLLISIDLEKPLVESGQLRFKVHVQVDYFFNESIKLAAVFKGLCKFLFYIPRVERYIILLLYAK